MWSYWETPQGASDGRYQTAFILKCCMSLGRILRWNVAGWRLASSSITSTVVDMWPLPVSYITHKKGCIPSASCVYAFCFNFIFAVWANSNMFLPALFGSIYVNQTLTNSHLCTYEEIFVKVEIYIGLNSEMRINTQFESTLTNYTKSDMITKRLVLLPVG